MGKIAHDRTLKVLIDVRPLDSGHAVRGVGMYTRFLSEALEKHPAVEVYRSGLENTPQKVDIVHYPFFDLFFPTLPLLKHARTFVTIHDVIPLIFPEFYPPGKRGKLAFIRQKWALKNVAGILTDSETSKRDIMKYLGVPAEKITVVYLAANPFLQLLDKAEVETFRKKNKLPKHYLLYVGDINYNKNVPQLIKALKFLPPSLKLVCVGKNFKFQEIPEWRTIEAQMALSNVAKRVVFLPDVLSDDYASLSALYSGAAVYVQPSLYEGFGLPVLEAMRCQTPVVAAGNSSLLEIGEGAVQFTGNTAEELASGIHTILNFTAKERAAWISKALQREQQFTWQKTADQTVEAYKKAL
jgi:glycosyltransferase involved in cell wall biosynthesis